MFIGNIMLNNISLQFIEDAKDMLHLNFGDNYEIVIIPKTSYAFQMKLKVKNSKQTMDFKASDVKGCNGTFKLAKMISKIENSNVQ